VPSISESRDSILQQLIDSELAAARVVTGLSPEQANWQPHGGASWSICQCLDHLARINRIYCQALLEATAHSTRGKSATVGAKPGWFGRLFVSNVEPPARIRVKAPKKLIPVAKGDPQVALQEFVDSHSAVRRVIASWDEMDFNRIRFHNPIIVLFPFTVATGLLIINAHDRRHLWQATRVKESSGFPAE